MSSILGEWLVRQSSPDTRKLSARPAGKPGDFLHVLENLRRSPPRHSLARPKAPACVWKAWRNLSGPMWFANQNQTLRRSRAASRWSAPGPGSRTCREDHAPSHRPQMSSGRLFLDRVARQQCPSPLHRHQQHNIHSSSDQAKGDISILPARGHFYFALTSAIFPIDTTLLVGYTNSTFFYPRRSDSLLNRQGSSVAGHDHHNGLVLRGPLKVLTKSSRLLMPGSLN